MPKPDFVQEATDETFQSTVFEKSASVPVIVDFWAEWCAPCRMLAPVLESLAERYAGKFVLVKANTEEVPQAASAFSVSGIPAVFAVIDGDIVDSFQGVLPEDSLRQWIDGVLGTANKKSIETLANSSPAEAIAQLEELIANDASDASAKIMLAGLLVENGRPDEAAKLIEGLEDRGFLEPEAEVVKAKAAIAHGSESDADELEARSKEDPNNLMLKLQSAKALAASGDFEAALIKALEIIELDRKGVGEDAREFMIQIFRALPDGHELTSDYRRKLSMALY